MGIWSKLRASIQRTQKPAEAPQLPEGVKPRGDVWANTYSGLGTSQYDPSVQTQYYTTYDITSRPQVIRAMMRSNPLGRKIVEKQVKMAWGSGVGYQVSGGGDGAERDLHGELRRLEVQAKIQRARTFAVRSAVLSSSCPLTMGLTRVNPWTLTGCVVFSTCEPLTGGTFPSKRSTSREGRETVRPNTTSSPLRIQRPGSGSTTAA